MGIIEDLFGFANATPMQYHVTVNGKDERLIQASSYYEAKEKALKSLGITMEDVQSGKADPNDIVVEGFKNDPYKINIVDTRNIIEVEWELVDEEAEDECEYIQ